MKAIAFIFAAMWICVLPVCGQLNTLHNHYRPGDVLIKLYPNPVESQLNIGYELKEDAKVSFELYSIEGMPVKKIQAKSQKAGIYNESIDCSGLYPKNYVLRITANGMFVNEIVIKK